MHTAPTPPGELLGVPDRIIVAPRTGVFRPLERRSVLDTGAAVRSGQLIGHVCCGDQLIEVTSPFEGQTKGVLAWPDERVRQYQPLLWLEAA